MGIEFEMKYRATPEILAAVAADTPGSTRHFDMSTTYYDTRERALSARNCTLRRRMENDTSVCTLKMPAGQLGRAEFEVECESILAAIPELCKLSGFEPLLSYARSGLQPVCGARFHRIAVTLQLEDCTLELALDQGVLMGGGREVPLCELEVELKAGKRESAMLYAQLLAHRYGLQPEPKSKFYRASLLAGGK